MTVGETIRYLRKRNKLSANKLGERCGMTGPQIRGYENGGRNPKDSTLKRILDGLGVSPEEFSDYVLGEKGNPLSGAFVREGFRLEPLPDSGYRLFSPSGVSRPITEVQIVALLEIRKTIFSDFLEAVIKEGI